jgi:hypothetical protein
MMIPAGGETRASRERRLMNDAINAAGSSLASQALSRHMEIRLTETRGRCLVDGRIELGT